MKANIRLARLWDVPIGLNHSWFLVLALVTWSLAAGFFPLAVPGLATGLYWLLGLLTSLLFFASVLAHELGHTYLAQRNGVPVRAITLFFFGGVAEITREPKSAGEEFRIAIAGPLVSVGLSAFFGAIYLLTQDNPLLATSSLWLARINLILAAFNMIPGFPLDGGRVLRALVWRLMDDGYRATRLASRIGQLVAAGFIGVGVFTALTGGLFNGLWLAFIGLFLNSAATGSRQQAEMRRVLSGITAGQLASRSTPRVLGRTPLAQLVDPFALSQGQRVFLVEDYDNVRGMFTLSDVAQVPASSWTFTTAQEIMIPRERLSSVRLDEPVTAALELMEEQGVAQVPVVESDAIVGVLSREQVLNYVRFQTDLLARTRTRDPQPALPNKA